MLMPSPISVQLQCPSTFPLLGNPIRFKSNFRINHNKTQHASYALNLPEKNDIFSNQKENNGLPIKENLDERTTKLGRESLVDKIKALPSKEKTEIITSPELNGDLGTILEFNDMLWALLTAQEPDLALKLFDEMSSYGLVPDSWTFSIVIRCYCENKNLGEAERVLGYMLENGFRPNFSAVTVLLNSLSKKGKLQRAFGVLDIMDKIGLKPTVQTYNCLLKGLCYVGRVEEAFEMLVRMKKEAIVEPDIFSYTAVMDGYCKVGRSDEAVELLNEALEMGLAPDVFTFNTLFNGFCVEGRPLEGLKILKLMREKDCKPDYISYSTLLHGLLKWRKTKTALRIYNEMVGIGLNVDKKMVNSLVRGLCTRSCKGRKEDLFEDAYLVFEKLKSDDDSVIDPITYDLVIQALCMGKKTDEASVNLQKMIQMGFSPRMVTFNGVIQALCAEGKVIEALFVLASLNEGGRVPSRVCYNILIDELNRHGSSLGACYMYGAALKRGLIPSSKPQQ
ncbi:Tetratricopeptide-like helical domain containing protein [Parasponia andersonii]|uniref:Tetratricopeptide-like helical domain containing protein n=1 Tax=Parasponia andersonii TaxID=3476 RepID=A0A2P5BS38_PARAD|nr:Tetratricopeptide-like helical domain containing protein [Parasponia andersonii]